MNKPASGPNMGIQIAILLAILTALGAGLYMWSRSAAPAGSKSVTFRVEGQGGYAKVSWKIGEKALLTDKTVNTPWEQTVVIPTGTQVILTAANPTSIGGATCKITLGGSAWKSSTVDKPNRGIACGGIVP